ncbi:MAG TPA: tRNA (5-methylaminomethyl-2-thiouridine)(34)-methyltransferase MnmD [Flavobacterium sp.]|nr:tRNA (5-methylaminomethyl-2-thiouridine)(34)-methyltransferase MnmD [Flavobacterium sp.]
MKRTLIVTEDGSNSLFIEQMGETYHSRHGAVQESLHVYIKNGLSFVEKDEIAILEFGFGTGLNALLTEAYAQKKQVNIQYETIEAYPLQKDEYELLNYDEFVQSSVPFNKLHEIPWNTQEALNERFSILKHRTTIESFTTDKKFDLIYFDVFGYYYQPELWSEEILKKVHHFLNINGLFVTYACKGIVNKTLKSLGFEVRKLAGPPGKREMTLAVKIF